MSMIKWIKKTESHLFPEMWTGYSKRVRTSYYRDRYSSYRKHRKVFDYHTHVHIRKAMNQGYLNITISTRQDHPVSSVSRHDPLADEVVVSFTTYGTPTFVPNMIEEINMIIAEGIDEYVRRCRISELEYLRWS